MGIKPDEFWSMIPSEFLLLIESFNEQQENKWDNYQYLAAWHAANIMNASGNLKRKVSVEKLLGKKQKKKKQTLSKEERKEQLKNLLEKFGY